MSFKIGFKTEENNGQHILDKGHEKILQSQEF